MLEDKRILAVIPARGGSKRLPGKNTLPLNGKPLICWTIEAALRSELIDEVIVSTDSESIAEISRQSGASVPFLRPAALATDTSSSISVLLHSLDFCAATGEEYDIVILLQPTSPLRDESHIDEALNMYISTGANGIISVCACEHSPLWSNILPEDQSLERFIRPETRGHRSQDLPSHYRLNGAVYTFDTNELRRQKELFYSPDVFAFIMDQRASVDIDTDIDFAFAETLMSQIVVS